MLTKREASREDACDVIVVGAGLMGVAIATRLAREGLDVAILEARSLASGATGRSAGMVLAGLPQPYSEVVASQGRETAREIWALNTEGRERLIETAERLDVAVERLGSLALASDDDAADALRASAEMLREDGFDARFEADDPLERDFRAALRQPDDAVVDAAALTRAMLNRSNVLIHEGTEVYDLSPEGDDVRVWARGRTVYCSAVVLAVNGYAPLVHAYFADKVAPVRNLIVAAPADDLTLEQPCTLMPGNAYCRQLSDQRLLLGAWQQRRAMEHRIEPNDVVQDTLARFASRHFPEINTNGVDRWSGIMGFTPDGLPLLGTLPDVARAYFAVGFGGRGLTWAFVAAEQLADAMLHDADLGLLSAERLK